MSDDLPHDRERYPRHDQQRDCVPTAQGEVWALDFQFDTTEDRRGDGYARLLVGDGSERTEIDLGYDTCFFAIQERDPSPVLSGEELDAGRYAQESANALSATSTGARVSSPGDEFSSLQENGAPTST